MRFEPRTTGAIAAACTAALLVSGPVSAKLTDLPPGSAEQKAAIKCVQTIQKQGSKYAAAHLKLIIKCKTGVIKGSGGSLGACHPLSGDLAAKDAGAAQKLADRIANRCGGSDHLCGAGVGAAADIPLADINWDIGSCRRLEQHDPGVAISHCGDIADCIASNVRFANHQVANEFGADQFDTALFGAAADPDKTNNKCQSGAFKALTKFYRAKSKILQKCWLAKTKLKGDDFDDAIPCPDTDTVKGKAKAQIEKAERKLAAKLCKQCGGDGDDDRDGTCDTPGASITPEFITAGFACAPITVPGSTVEHFYDNDANPANGVDCAAMGDPLVDTIQEYVDCLACVAEYKADCVAHTQNGNNPDHGMVYPIECDTILCGNGVLDPNEACDPLAPGLHCPGAGNGLQDCTTSCTCACPSSATFESDPNDPASGIDSGFSGFAHGMATLGQALVTVSLSGGTSGTPGLRDPDCGVMTVGGPIPNPAAGAGQIDNRRCSVDSSMPCSVDSDCSAAETCVTYFGSFLPLSAGGVSSCITNRFVAPIVGTADIETGSSATTVALTSEIVLGMSIGKPCANCLGDLVVNDGSLDGTCDSGTRMGMGCDVGGVSPQPAFNGTPTGNPNEYCTAAGVPLPCCSGPDTGSCVTGTSLDCPAGAGSNILPIDLSNSTGSEALTVSASGPPCTANGFGGATCMCDTCNTAAAEPCNSDADCPGAALGSCGGLRCTTGGSSGATCTMTGSVADPACHAHCTGAGVPDACCTGPGTGFFCSACTTPGEPTRPNHCVSGLCTAGVCTDFAPGYCGPQETFRGCLANSHCPFLGDTCSAVGQPCFEDDGVVGGIIAATGTADLPVNDTARPTVVATFCIPPVAEPAINTASGFPGAARVTLAGEAFGLP